jgi:valyl-tRNA synthetase
MRMREEGTTRKTLGDLDVAALAPDDHHILARLHDTMASCRDHLERYRLNDYARELYDFLWHHFCDWYVEYSKDALMGDDAGRKEQVLAVMHEVLSNALRLLHPLMPFITEELWHVMGYADSCETIMRAPWPESDRAGLEGRGLRADLVDYVDAKHELIRAARNLRADFQISPALKIHYVVKARDKASAGLLEQDLGSLKSLMRSEPLEVAPRFEPEQAMPSALTALGTVYMSLEGVDVAAEIARQKAQLEKLDKNLFGVTRKLENESFVAKAPAEVVDREKALKEDLLARREKMESMIASLSEMAR